MAAIVWEEDLVETERQADVWATESSKFLATHFSDQHQFRFIKAVSAAPGQESYDLAQTLTDGIRVIHEVIQEVGGLRPNTHDLSSLVKTFGPIFPGH